MTDLKNRLLERLVQLQQDADSAISYKEFGAPSEQDYEILRQLYAVKRDAAALESREDEQQFLSVYVETVASSTPVPRSYPLLARLIN
eukprot:469952-Pyramimonas_sp.AAC.1